MRKPRCKLDSNRPAERSAMKDDAVRGQALVLDEIAIHDFAGGVAALLRRPAGTFAIAGVIEDKHRLAEQALPAANALGTMAQVAGVAVAEQDRTVGRLPFTQRAPPAVDERAIGQMHAHILGVQVLRWRL